MVLLQATCTMMWFGLAAASTDVQAYYGRDSHWVNVQSSIYLGVFCVVALPVSSFIDLYGVEVSLTGASVLSLAGSLLQIVAGRSCLWLVTCGSVTAALAQPFIINSVASLTTTYFHEREHATVTMAGSLGGFVGSGFTLGMSPMLVEHIGVPGLLLVHAAVCAAALVLSLAAFTTCFGGVPRGPRRGGPPPPPPTTMALPFGDAPAQYSEYAAALATTARVPGLAALALAFTFNQGSAWGFSEVVQQSITTGTGIAPTTLGTFLLAMMPVQVASGMAVARYVDETHFFRKALLSMSVVQLAATAAMRYAADLLTGHGDAHVPTYAAPLLLGSLALQQISAAPGYGLGLEMASALARKGLDPGTTVRTEGSAVGGLGLLAELASFALGLLYGNVLQTPRRIFDGMLAMAFVGCIGFILLPFDAPRDMPSPDDPLAEALVDGGEGEDGEGGELWRASRDLRRASLPVEWDRGAAAAGGAGQQKVVYG